MRGVSLATDRPPRQHTLSRTAMGVRCKDGVVLAVEKVLASPMMVKSSGKKLHRVAGHLAVVCGCVVRGETPGAHH